MKATESVALLCTVIIHRYSCFKHASYYVTCMVMLICKYMYMYAHTSEATNDIYISHSFLRLCPGASLNYVMASFSTTTGLTRGLRHPGSSLETVILMYTLGSMSLAEGAQEEVATTVVRYVGHITTEFYDSGLGMMNGY